MVIGENMKINDIFYDNQYDEAYKFVCNNQPHMTIIEIEADEKGRRYKIVEKIKSTANDLAEQEMRELKVWFNGYYTQHEQKYRRLHLLNKLTDEGSDALSALTALYTEAEEKRSRIQALEAQIGLA